MSQHMNSQTREKSLANAFRPRATIETRYIPQNEIKFHLQNKLPWAICNDKHHVAPAGGSMGPPEGFVALSLGTL